MWAGRPIEELNYWSVFVYSWHLFFYSKQIFVILNVHQSLYLFTIDVRKLTNEFPKDMSDEAGCYITWQNPWTTRHRKHKFQRQLTAIILNWRAQTLSINAIYTTFNNYFNSCLALPACSCRKQYPPCVHCSNIVLETRF